MAEDLSFKLKIRNIDSNILCIMIDEFNNINKEPHSKD